MKSWLPLRDYSSNCVSQSSDTVEITVSIKRIVYASDSGFTVANARREPAGGSVRIVGELTEARPGQKLRLTGHWFLNPQYGKEFKILSSREVIPKTNEDIARFLQAHLSGVGPAISSDLVQHFGDQIFKILDKNPTQIQSIPGIGNRKYQKIMSSWKQHRANARQLLFLQSLALGPETVAKIVRLYGQNAEKAIRDNPYRLANEIKGIGFLTADQLAGKMQIPSNSSRRIEAGLLFEISQAEQNGHSCIPDSNLINLVTARLNLKKNLVKLCLDNMVEQNLLVRQKAVPSPWMIFSKQMDRLEREVAHHLQRIATSHPLQTRNLQTKFNYSTDMHSRLTLDSIQLEALNRVKEKALVVLTGGPGTGKTTLIKMIVTLFNKSTVKIAAPTGRAAQRAQESADYPASTIHRLLEFDPGQSEFKYKLNNKLNAEIIIIDESSMLDLPLCAALLRALKSGVRLILVGDVDQLPSVGPGRVLGDIIESGVAEVIRLKRIFRQAQKSRIIANAHKIINGIRIDPGKKQDGGDFFFISREVPSEIKDLVKRLPERLADRLNIDPLDDVQVLSPMYRGLLGIDQLNIELQAVLNPDAPEYKLGNRVFRLGDKVMQIQNNYDLDVFNGDIGRIESISSRTIDVRFGKRILTYEKEIMDQIVLAYACSIHKSQGSEYPAVVIPLHTQHYIMLKRNLLYTGITRGKQMVVIVGSGKALEMAMNHGLDAKRYSMLSHRIRNSL